MNQARVPEFDGLRAIAAMAVIALHLGLGREALWLSHGVDLFFVLSGFLITRIILNHHDEKGFLKTFYLRRSLRIWPIYYLSLLAFLVIRPYLPIRQPTNGIWNYLTYTQFFSLHWGQEPRPFTGFFRHTWTLALEEQFYLLWPLIGVLGGRRLLLLAVAVSIGLSNWARFSFHPWTLITNLDGFALGGLIAYGLEFRAKHAQRVAKWPELLLMVVASALLLWPLSQTIFGGTGGDQTDPLSAHTAFMLEITRFRLLAACIVALVVCLSGKRVLAPLRHPILVYLGTISYGIYLYHVPIYHLISPNHSRLVCTDPMWVDLLKLVATLGVAALSWKFLEQPILRLKDRFPHHEGRAPSRSPGHRTDAAHPTNSSSTFGTIPAAAPRSSSVRTARRPTGP